MRISVLKSTKNQMNASASSFYPMANPNPSNYKKVNNFEDLVSACVDSASDKDNKLICYKKRYLVSLKNGFMSPSTSLNGANQTKTKPDVIEPNKIYTHSTSSFVDNFHDKPPPPPPIVNSEHLNKVNLSSSVELSRKNAMKKPVTLCSRCKSLINISNNDKEQDVNIQNRIKRFQQPVPGDSALDEMELNSNTAGKFIDLIILEDRMIRKKISDGKFIFEI